MVMLWVDIETTGLDPRTDSILEVAAIVTTDEYEELGGIEQVVHFPQDEIYLVEDYVRQMHTQNGLWEDCIRSSLRISKVDVHIAAFVQLTCGDVKPVLAGNSVHFDRSFLKQHCPELSSLVHYRNFDVRTLQTFFDGVLEPICRNRTASHRAMADIEHSLETARYYRSVTKRWKDA